MCFHERRWWMSLMAPLLTPYFAANAERDSIRAADATRIARTSSSERRQRGFSVPVGDHERPRFTRSATLSAFDPKARCAGLQHAGLSQACRTHCPTGMAPAESSQQMRCALHCLPRYRMTPYPKRKREPVHSQHSSGPRRSTLDQNRSCSGLPEPLQLMGGILA